MTLFQDKPAAPGFTLPALFLAPVNVLVTAAGAWMRAMRHRASVRQLLDADEHMLRDIGLTRSDVRAALSGPPGSDPSEIVSAFAVQRCPKD